MDPPKKQEKTDVCHRTAPPQLPSGSSTPSPEKLLHQFCGSSPQPVDGSVHSGDSEPLCLNGVGCDCPQCRRIYGRHSRHGASSSPRRQDHGGPGRRRPGRPPPMPSQDQDLRPHSKKIKVDEEPRADRPARNPNDWLKDFLENCQQLG